MARASRPPPDDAPTPAPPAEPAPEASPAVAKSPGLPPPPAPPKVPPPGAAKAPAPATPKAVPAAKSSSVERVAAKESFAPDESLPAFTFPILDEATKQEVLRRVEKALGPTAPQPSVERPAAPEPSVERPATPQTSVERVAARESFSEDEPLPAFTFPVLDEATKQEVLRRVEKERAAKTRVALRSPGAPPAEDGGADGSPDDAPPSASADGESGGDLPPSAAGAVASAIGAGQAAPTRPPGPSAGERASAIAKAWLTRALDGVDRGRTRLPAGLRTPLARVPTGVLLAALAALALVVVVVVLSLISGGSDETATEEPPPLPAAPKEDPIPREIEDAKKQGSAALAKLAAKHPKDHRVLLALGASQSAEGEHAAAVESVSKALAAHPDASAESTAGEVLGLAVRKRNTTDAAFTLLEGPMGAAGADGLYDLSIDPKVELPLRGRAEKWVRSEAFKKVADLDVAMAAALRYAKNCAERHDLMARAGKEGGRRTLDFLNVAKTPAGCGSGARKDCYPCLRKDDALKEAIAAIEKRSPE